MEMLFLDVTVPAHHQSDGPTVPTPAVEGIERDVRRAVEGGGAQKGTRLYYVSLITISGSKSCKFVGISYKLMLLGLCQAKPGLVDGFMPALARLVVLKSQSQAVRPRLFSDM